MLARALSDSTAVLHEGRAGLELGQLVKDPVFRGEGIRHGSSDPVLLVPGFLMPDAGMRTMARWLRRIGYAPHRAHLGLNADCGEIATKALESRAAQLAVDHGRRVAVVGHSRGGAFARALAVRRPDLVSGVITLGTPDVSATDDFHPALAGVIKAVTGLEKLGAPSVLGRSCFTGACCATFRAQASGPVPDGVLFEGIVPGRDRVVRDRAWLRNSGQHATTVDASHSGVIVNRHAYRVIADSLGAA